RGGRSRRGDRLGGALPRRAVRRHRSASDLGDVIDAREAAARAATRVARESYGKLVAFLAAPARDVPGAEDALSDAFAAALAVWPTKGVPANPEGWLAKTARRRLIDAARRRRSADKASDALAVIEAELKE